MLPLLLPANRKKLRLLARTNFYVIPPDCGRRGKLDRRSELESLFASGAPELRKPIRLLLADDLAVVRHGLRAFLESHGRFEVCGEAVNGRDAVRKSAHLTPDVVIMDLQMPLLGGVEATREIAKEHPHVQVVIFDILDSERILASAYAAGARVYVCKTGELHDLLPAIDALVEGHFFVSATILRRFGLATVELQSLMAGESPEILTSRERQVVKVLTEGKSNKEAAEVLGISVKTAETHRARIMRKLKMRSFAELVHYAIRNDYIRVAGGS